MSTTEHKTTEWPTQDEAILFLKWIGYNFDYENSNITKPRPDWIVEPKEHSALDYLVDVWRWEFMEDLA